MKKIVTGLLLGAGLLALAGCKDQNNNSRPFGGGGILNSIGQGELYGCDPKGSYKDCYKKGTVQFNPKIYSVIYMRFGNLRSENRQSFVARHAYFYNSSGHENLECEIRYLRNPSSGNHSECPAIQPKDVKDTHTLAAHRNLGKPVGNTSRRPFQKFRDNFDGVLHGSQQKVFVVIDNHQIKFNSIIPMSFTPFGSYDFKEGIKPTRKPNSSMFNAKISDLEIKTGTGTKTKTLDILSYDNYYLDENGVQIDKKKKQNTTFSINYNLLICVLNRKACDKIYASTAQTGDIIPIAIDPDTGNGWGSNP